MGFLNRLSRYLDDVLLLPDEVRDLARTAQVMLERGEPTRALDHLSTALSFRPDHPQLLFLAGEAWRRLGEDAEAEKVFRAALEADPEHAPSRVSLGQLLRQTGRAAAAAEELRRAVPLLWSQGATDLAAQALLELAHCHLTLERPDRAARELRKALSLRTEDPQLLALLARVLAERLDDADRARQAASRAVALAENQSDGALLREVGHAALAAGLERDAARVLERAQQAGEKVELLLGRAYLALGEALRAHEHALRALGEEGSSAEPHRLRAEIAFRAADPAGALAALEAALALEPEDEETLRQATQTAALVAPERAQKLAAALLARSPGDPLARAVRVRGDVALGRDLGAVAASLVQLRAEAPAVPEVWLAQAELALAQGDGEAALAALEQVESLEPDRRELASLGVRACRLVAGGGGTDAEPDLFDVLERAHGLLSQRPALGALTVELAKLREDYDKPLLLTVMGEFNAGKSTFINALLGEPVAPMGVTPTTATINLLKYGAEKKVRVLQRSGTVKELAYEDLAGWLKGLSRDVAAEVRQVEILYPAEVLTRVNLVDTPGFNSIVEEHEKVARDFLARADAVVWLFDAGQPGKESEREALERLARLNKRVMGVVNKADRLAPEALTRVMDHLRREGLGGLVEDVLPLSARTALEAKRQADGATEQLTRSGLPDLERKLEERFYSQARLIKRLGSASRLVEVLEAAVAQEAESHAQLRRSLAVMDQARLQLKELARELAQSLSDRVTPRLAQVHDEVADDAAEEVLEFVRPKRHALDSHHFGSEDRLYLLSLIEERLENAFELLSQEMTEEVEAVLRRFENRVEGGEAGSLTGLDPAGLAQDCARALSWSLLTFERGLARGGRADQFFDRELPRLELTQERVAVRIKGWWAAVQEQEQELIRHETVALTRRLDDQLLAHQQGTRRELARRRRSGVRPLSGFAALAREWARPDSTDEQRGRP